MRMTTLLWGLFVSAIGILAILRGAGMEISIVGAAITLLIAFGIALGIAAFVPQKDSSPGPDADVTGTAQPVTVS